MSRRKIVFVRAMESESIQKVKEIAPDWEVISGKEQSDWENDIKEAEIIVGWRKGLDELCLTPDSKLRWLQSWSAGINYLPLEKLAEKNVNLTNASGVHAYPISETIFALMLSLTRKIHTYIRNQASKTWDEADIKLEIHHKTIGIIGIGAIGKETAKIAKAFNMTVLGVRNSNKPEEYVDEMYTTDELHSVLPRCDYVVVTLPLTADTHHLFSYEQFKQMKPSAFFINIGRGELANEKELIQALQDQQIAGAGLDVFSTEPLEENNPLWDMANVIITPHTAGLTEFYEKRVVEDIFLPNLTAYLDGDTPHVNLIDYAKGY
ncbi:MULTISPECIES: D-2-hydroxyacid dehydrogenase [Bacillus]|uniref:2-hydroxyacid dehydrogenase n=2 Tax=Bacillus TaxID=1386 RepID=A0A0M3R8T1_9BACI|nr:MULTISPECIES: D-2-hydroxyacid dehydrogenase [Bacillus]ALC80222.1 2-hydroxyacid dehydrogenase [Bacillus gobiensis]MBP1082789.1 phosphoglycerate dehydrogenase-like enzyme [Bacillus capparidis]MED1098433.1 D-2-hydroxyacid dehydrogenase [Bacillus capparidis]